MIDDAFDKELRDSRILRSKLEAKYSLKPAVKDADDTCPYCFGRGVVTAPEGKPSHVLCGHCLGDGKQRPESEPPAINVLTPWGME